MGKIRNFAAGYLKGGDWVGHHLLLIFGLSVVMSLTGWPHRRLFTEKTVTSFLALPCLISGSKCMGTAFMQTQTSFRFQQFLQLVMSNNLHYEIFKNIPSSRCLTPITLFVNITEFLFIFLDIRITPFSTQTLWDVKARHHLGFAWFAKRSRSTFSGCKLVSCKFPLFLLWMELSEHFGKPSSRKMN